MNENLISAFLNKIQKNYSQEDFAKIRMAAEYADKMHGDQKRKSGEPYIIHPLAVAETLAMQLNMDADTVCAGLLHDVIEDTSATAEDVEGMFGKNVCELVQGVTKIAAIKRMLDYSMTHQTIVKSTICWIFNFTSGYSKMTNLFGQTFATSEGYRDNAAHTNAAVLDYLNQHEAGPMGIVMMDYAGVDRSEGYEVKGLKLTTAIIANNFKYLQSGDNGLQTTVKSQRQICDRFFTSVGIPLGHPQRGINIVWHSDGTIIKSLYK